MEKLSRRKFLKALGGTAGLVICSGNLSRIDAKEEIKIGYQGILSGRSAEYGKTGLESLTLWAEELNAKGGLLGREIKIVVRDNEGNPEVTARVTKELMVDEKADFVLDQSSSSSAWASKEMTKKYEVLTIASGAETTDFSQDPKHFNKYHFSSCYSTLHTAIGAVLYVGKLIKEGRKLKNWYMLNNDYTYGRSSYDDFVQLVKPVVPDFKIVGESWPKLFEPDFTPYITRILQLKPDAVYTSLWGGDVASFVKQGDLYGLFEKVAFFCNDLADYYLFRSIKQAIGKVPSGIHSGLRILENFPDTDLNRDFAKRYTAKWNKFPVKWSQEGYLACRFYEEAVKKAGTFEKEAVVKALEGITVKAPWGSAPNSTVMMRKKDHKGIGMALGWGETISEPPFVKNAVSMDWERMLEFETKWLKEKGWL